MLTTELAYALRGTLTVLVVLVIAFPLVSGWGLWAKRIFRAGAPSESLLAGFLPFWLGVCALIVALQIWNLFWPIQWPATVGAAVVGASGLVVFRRDLSAFARKLDRRALVVWAVIFVPLLVWVANRAITDSVFSDAGLYHFPKIRWLNEYAAPPGLANLSWLLGYNQSFFTFLALFNATPYFNQGHHVANALLTAALTAQCVWAAASVLTRPRSASPVALALALFIPLAAGQCLDYICSSPTPDLSVTVFGMVLFAMFAELALLKRSESQATSRLANALVFMAVCACTLKLSIAPYSAALAGLALLIVWARRSSARDAAWLVGVGLAAFALAIVPWMITNIINSGYPFFPSPALGIKTDWSLNANEVAGLERSVRTWARIQNLEDIDSLLVNWEWLPLWTQRMMRQFVLQPLALIPLGLGAWAVLRLLDRGRTRFNPMMFAPFVPPLVWAIAWFWIAPHQRYIGSGLWVMEAWALVLPLHQLVAWSALDARAPTRALTWLARGVVIGGVALTFALLADRAPLVTKGVKANGFTDISSATMIEFVTESELRVYVPAFGGQEKVWDYKLPSTNSPTRRLELRGNGLGEGFRLQPLAPR